jgi:DNA helicase-2/ATP-dependent DNA helicase PcrA
MDLSLFNDAQKEVILLPISPKEVPDILVVAGAGSGKTRVLVHRIAHLREQFIDPRSILAMTFTKKAAREMKERVNHVLGSNEPIYISTFHAMSADLLRQHHHAKFDILDSHDQDRLIKSLIKTHGLSDVVAFKDFDQWFTLQRNQCASPEVDCADDAPVVRAYRMLARLYRQGKAIIGQGVLDFDDLLERLVDVLQHDPELCRQLHHRWKYILVDEYQDTNRIQFKLLSLLRGPDCQLLQVGDEDQLIYSWRGAEIEHILSSYQASLRGGKVRCVMLNTNYRCSGNILEVANQVVGENKQRTGKTLSAHRPAGKPVQVRRFENEYEEADRIADQIDLWNADGVPYSSVAVLMRTNRMSRALERSLIKSRIPYTLYAGVAMFDSQEVRLVMSLLQLTQEPSESFHLQYIASIVKMGVGPATLQKMDTERSARGEDWFSYLSTHPKASSHENVKALVSGYPNAKRLLDKGNLCGAMQSWVMSLDVLEFFDKDTRDSREATLLSLSELLSDYESKCLRDSVPSTLQGFQESRLLDDTLTEGETSGRVHIMTVHKSKGLEFRCGVVMGLQDGVFPMKVEDRSIEQAEEDVRLAYVAITRFMEELLITRAGSRTGFMAATNYSTILDPHLRDLIDSEVVKYVR